VSRITIAVDDGRGTEWQYAMPTCAEQLLAEFAAGEWAEISLVEEAPAIRRYFPVKFTIRREA